MNKILSKPGLLKFFNNLPADVREHFIHLPRLVENFPLDVSLAYVFAKVEAAHLMAIYCGVTKLHSCDSAVAWKAVGSYHMTRANFREKIEMIYGKAVPPTTSQLLVQAEGTRDRVMHGKASNDDDKRNAIAHALQYAAELNDFLASVNGPRPFGDLRGFKGAAKGLPPTTTRWVLKGMGLGA